MISNRMELLIILCEYFYLNTRKYLGLVGSPNDYFYNFYNQYLNETENDKKKYN